MIDKALTYISDFLNQQINSLYGGEENLITVSSLVNPDGGISENIENKIVVSIINLEHETTIKSMGNYRPDANKYGKQSPPVYLNIYLMISSNFQGKNYTEGLKLLSNVIMTLQSNTYFTRQLNPEMPEPIDQLNLEIVNMPINEMSHIWSGIGAKYVPSMLYKLRMIAIDGDKIKAEISAVGGLHQSPKTKK